MSMEEYGFKKEGGAVLAITTANLLHQLIFWKTLDVVAKVQIGYVRHVVVQLKVYPAASIANVAADAWTNLTY